MITMKKINKSGGITIPSVIRRDYSIDAGELVDVDIDRKTGSIILHRNHGMCMFCASYENLTQYKGRFICKECAGKIKEAFGE